MALIALLIVVGLVLLFLETILPGLIAGALGVCCLIAAVTYAYFEFGIKTGNLTLSGVFLLLLVASTLWVKFFPESTVAQTFVSKSHIGNVGAERPELLGESGVTLTALRPTGMALLNGKRVDVVSEGAFVEKGTPVKVIAIEGLRVVVRAVEAS